MHPARCQQRENPTGHHYQALLLPLGLQEKPAWPRGASEARGGCSTPGCRSGSGLRGDPAGRGQELRGDAARPLCACGASTHHKSPPRRAAASPAVPDPGPPGTALRPACCLLALAARPLHQLTVNTGCRKRSAPCRAHGRPPAACSPTGPPHAGRLPKTIGSC